MRRLAAIAAFIFAAINFWHTAQAGIEDAMTAYAHGDYPTAFELLKEPASNGDEQAQALLGYMYDAGIGTPENDAEAVKWYEKAALQGDPISQLNVGIMYADGLGTAKNMVRALAWFTLASQSDPDSEVHQAAVHEVGLAESQMTDEEIARAQQLIRGELAPK